MKKIIATLAAGLVAAGAITGINATPADQGDTQAGGCWTKWCFTQ